MFSLIITIISIALVAALALATIYYGGDAFSKGGDAAIASQLINEGQQLQGSLTLRKVQAPDATALAEGGTNADLVTALSPAYLSQVPAKWTVEAAAADADAIAETFESGTVSAAVCQEVNKKAGFATPAAVTDLAGKVYGCLTADNKVTYKF